MALRLTGTTSASERHFSASELATQAGTLLAAGNTKAYADLFERASAQSDPQEHYRGLLSLVESGLNAAPGSAPARATEIFLAIARGLVDALDQEPREPVLLNYAGVAFYELWSLDAARALFKAALRLDPALPHLKRNLAEIGRRTRGRAGGARTLRPLHGTLPALARRAKRAASLAKPASGLTLSLCMIVRDEEEMLPRCLAAAAPAVDEIVIVDTGSTDRTIEIARSFGARVIEREWTGSFAEARNVSFDAATGDWLIYLDADEVLVAEDVERLRALTGQVWREAFYLLETSYTGEAGDGTGMTHPALRVFRNRPGYRFEGRMHEQIAHTLPTQVPGRIEHTAVRVEHYGYLGSVRDAKEKSKRNIELLKTQQAEGHGGAFLHFNLGTEYVTIGDNARALHHFEHAWEIVKARGEQARDYVPTLLVRLISALRTQGRAEEAVELTDDALHLFPGFTDLVFAQAVALRALGREQEAEESFERCLQMGDAPARYGATVGAGTYLPLLALAELALARGDLGAAREDLERCLAAHPTFYTAVAPLASVLLRSGLDPRGLVAEIERHVGTLTPTVRFVIAGALHRHGALELSEHEYREVLRSRPTSSQVRVTLADVLLQRGQYAEASELARGIAPDDPFVALAARIEVFSSVADRRLELTADAMEHARAAGVSEAELDVFARWAALAAGQAPAGQLGIAGTPLLGVVLERLLGLHDFESFELLLPMLQSSELPRREQQELLAGMYLRYGFLQSAAREWMAVCETAPDARAFLGLAQVALAHGAREDAATLAAQALALDGASAGARRLLEVLAPDASAAPSALVA